MKELNKSRTPDWNCIIFLTLTPILAIVGTILHFIYEGPNIYLIIIAFFFYFLIGLSITAGYHRLFSHRSYNAHPFIRILFIILGAAAFQNSVLKWCRDHRIHHQKCDKEEDPYCIKKGFWWAHIGWIFFKDENHDYSNVKDLSTDPWIRWQDRNIFLIGGIVGIIIPTIIGFMMGYPIGGFAIISMLRIAFTHHMTFFINSLCHIVGKATYSESNSSKDSFWMAFFTFGEGYHNFHHAFQIDYRNGILWYDFDPTKWLICALSKLKLANNLKQVDDEIILKTKFELKNEKIKKLIPLASKTMLSDYEILNNKFLKEFNKFIIDKKKLKSFLKTKSPNRKIKKELLTHIDRSKRELKNYLREWDSLIYTLKFQGQTI